MLLLSRISIHFGYFAEDKDRTAKLIAQFHARMNAGQFDEIYDDACIDFRNSQSRDYLIDAMRKSRDEFGIFRKIESSNIDVVVNAPVQVRAVYDSVFENGEATERFIFVEDNKGQKIQLLFYRIDWKNRPKGSAGIGST